MGILTSTEDFDVGKGDLVRLRRCSTLGVAVE